MSARPDRAVRATLDASRVCLSFAVPPFPGRRFDAFERLPQSSKQPVALRECVALLRDLRVGGSYWARQPALPQRYLLIRSSVAASSCAALVEEHGEALPWRPEPLSAPTAERIIVGECDPWHMLASAGGLVCEADDEIRPIAAILGIPTYLVDGPGDRPLLWTGDAERFLAAALRVDATFSNPFGETPLNFVEMIRLCAFWRALIDANRGIDAGVGFAFWKQDSVMPLLWSGGAASGFFDRSTVEKSKGAVAVWRSKAPHDLVDRLAARGTRLVEVEDGFLRSSGLGADCVPPLSLTVDRLGAYFDPGQPSELENLLQHGSFSPAMVDRARRLRETIVAAGLGKYDRGEGVAERYEADRRHILVTGQVEDDRSILTGGAGLASNLELLQRVRAREPDSFLIYKPHPDVVAGHRKGHIHEADARRYADMVITDGSISALIAMVDEVHVNTSLTGFEALMRGKHVTTYGVPFYAGWGLTCDLGAVPARRTTARSLDELVAATLLIYPRYVDPITGLPCPAEVVVDRLCAGAVSRTGLLVSARRLQGRLKRRLQWLAR